MDGAVIRYHRGVVVNFKRFQMRKRNACCGRIDTMKKTSLRATPAS
jgi:hypothetical protein